ncbi:MAG: phosphoenolpyruvate--protein phosphotransferase [Spirochaetaceae bacterium]|nr:phosphoenolpyruvate--protein phosphotransferase [Spirochaetaceae bacterium]
MKTLKGIAASPGIASGRAFLYADDGLPEIPRYHIHAEDAPGELARLEAAFIQADAEISRLHERALMELGKEKAEIIAAHRMMLEDEEFRGQIRTRFEANHENIDWVVFDYCQELAQLLGVSSDPYLRERSADVADVSRRLLSALLPVKRVSLADLEETVILVAHDILPSELLAMRPGRVRGIVMDMGSRTSHTAILAQAFGIPAVLGLSFATREISGGDTVAVDGLAGEVAVNPAPRALAKYRAAAGRYQKHVDSLRSGRDLPAETKDGRRVALAANIEVPEEARGALEFGAEGIGLYRSEFLFLTPGQNAAEENQFRAYLRVVETMGSRPVTIRTVDVGGDKVNPGLHGVEEKNPLLGWRAVRFCFAAPEFFKTQLRAILRASARGKVRIMFPMISGVEELEQALVLLEEAKAECRKKKQPFDEEIEAGTMIEVPSAAMTADLLAKKSAFFSIGTNDLIQYSLAVDRGNERVSYLARPTHPAVLRLLKITIDAAHGSGIRAAMCGEFAGEVRAAPLLIGLGLDEFSMSGAQIPRVKRVIREAGAADCRDLAEKILAAGSPGAADALLDEWFLRHPGAETA